MLLWGSISERGNRFVMSLKHLGALASNCFFENHFRVVHNICLFVEKTDGSRIIILVQHLDLPPPFWIPLLFFFPFCFFTMSVESVKASVLFGEKDLQFV